MDLLRVLYWIVLIAVVAWAVYGHFQKDGDNEPIKGDWKRPAFRIASYVSWAACGYSIFVATGNPGLRIGLAIAFFFLGFFLHDRANEAYTEEAKELEQKIEIKKKQAEYKEQLIREPHVKSEVTARMLLERIKSNSEKKRAELENSLLDTAKQHGLNPDEIVAINREKYLSEIRLAERGGMIQQDTQRSREQTEIDLERRWKEIVQDLDAGDLLDLSEQQLIKKETAYLEEMHRRRYELLHGPDPEEVKVALLARYDKNIRYLEAKIDARQTGLLLPENGQEAERIGEGEADSPGYSQPQIEAVQEQAPAKRGRGRPRKNPPV